MSPEVELLHRCLSQAREAYRQSRKSTRQMLEEAEVLGASNPDGAELRRQANAQLRANLQTFVEALAAYQEGVLASCEPGIMQNDKLIHEEKKTETPRYPYRPARG